MLHNELVAELNFVLYIPAASNQIPLHRPHLHVHRGREWRQRNQKQGQNRAQMKPEEDQRHDKQTVPKGTCQTMCPAHELRARERQKRLHRFEILQGTENERCPRGDPLHAVKEYFRPAAGKDATNPADLRPTPVLLKTVCYLINDVAASPDLHPWTEASRTSTILLLQNNKTNVDWE